MFISKAVKTANNSQGISKVQAEMIVESGGVLKGSNKDQREYIVITKHGYPLKLVSERGYPDSLNVTFFNKIEKPYSSPLVKRSEIPECSILRMSGHGSEQIKIELFSSDYKHGMSLLFKFTTSGSTNPLYLVFGEFKNRLKPDQNVFYFSGSDSIGAEIFPSLTQGTNGETSQIVLPVQTTPTQTGEVYTASEEVFSANTGNRVLFPSMTAANYNAVITAGAGIPLTPFNIHVRDKTGDIYWIGTIQDIFYASTKLPDGATITKGERTFKVCRSSNSFQVGSILVEV